jgi:hypothetical protein
MLSSSSKFFATFKDGGPQILQKFKSHLKILGDIKLTQTKFHAEDPQILLATVCNLFAGRPGDRGVYTSELVVWIYSSRNRRVSAVLSKVFRAFPQRIQANSENRCSTCTKYLECDGNWNTVVIKVTWYHKTNIKSWQLFSWFRVHKTPQSCCIQNQMNPSTTFTLNFCVTHLKFIYPPSPPTSD